MERYEYLNGPPAPRMVAELAMRHDALVKQLADAQATIAALQARVQELEEWVQDQSTANLETMRHVDEMQSRAMDAESQLTQRTAERDTARRRVDELEAREVDVVMLREGLEQRTAELEAANQRVMGERNLSNSWMKKHDELLAKVHKAGQFGAVVVQDVLKERDTIQAEFERVKGELVEATHNANVYQSLYSTGCMDRALLENELRDIRTLIAALPKVEGEIMVSESLVLAEDPDMCSDMSDKDEAMAYAALLKHRQGMEG